MSDYLPPVIARLSMNTDDFDAKIEMAKAKIRELRKDLRDKITVDLNDTAAKARLTELTRDRKVNVRVDMDRSSLNRLAGGLMGLGSKIPGELGSNAGFLPAIPLPAIAAGIPIAGALLTELLGLASGFTAAGAGAGAFYALAHPAINNLTQDVQGLDQANYKLGIAENAYKLDPSKTNLRALTRAQDTYNATLRQTQQDSGGAAGKMMALRQEYGKLTQAFQPQVYKLMGDGLSILQHLLPALVPMANAFTNALDPLLKRFDKFIQSKAGQDWLKKFTSEIGPAVTAIGNGLAKAGPALMRLLTLMSRKDVANAITIAFTVLTDTIEILTYMIGRFMKNYDQMSGIVKRDSHDIRKSFDSVRHGVATMGHDVAHNFDTVRHAAASWFHDIAHYFDDARHAIASMANWFRQKLDDVGRWFRQLPGKILSALGNLGGLLLNAGKQIMHSLLQGLINGWNDVAGFVSSIAHKIASLKGPLDYDRKLLIPHGQAIMDGLMEGLDSRMGALTGQLQGITGTISGAAAGGAGGAIVIHNVVELDGRQVYTAMQSHAVQTQRRTGHAGLQKRTR